MGADTATDTGGWNIVTIGPYVAAAAALVGPPRTRAARWKHTCTGSWVSHGNSR